MSAHLAHSNAHQLRRLGVPAQRAPRRGIVLALRADLAALAEAVVPAATAAAVAAVDARVAAMAVEAAEAAPVDAIADRDGVLAEARSVRCAWRKRNISTTRTSANSGVMFRTAARLSRAGFLERVRGISGGSTTRFIALG